MASYVDQERWFAALQQPDWYLRLGEEYERLLTRARSSPSPLARAIADEVYSFVERFLEEGLVALGTDGPEWDAERQPIDSAVIHHTHLPPGITSRRIDAIHLMRIYARYYADPAPSERSIRGTLIHSGHFRGGRQVFVAYHWLVRRDGTCERLLEDTETGWHAGNWDVNCRSVGICLDGRFDEAEPPPEMLAAVVRLLQRGYPEVVHDRVLGHREINRRTTCPGATFLGGWKSRLVRAVRDA